eukprot:COSAG01_NODE_45147_length_412_cov_0.699681_1_plen_63_part_10
MDRNGWKRPAHSHSTAASSRRSTSASAPCEHGAAHEARRPQQLSNTSVNLNQLGIAVAILVDV